MALQYNRIQVSIFAQNCTVLWCDQKQKAAVVDPGGDVNEITAFLTNHSLRLEKILLTHGHIDHVGGAKTLAQQFNAPIEGPMKADNILLDRLPEQAQMFGFRPVCQPFLPDQWLNEGDVINIGNESLSVLHCPGHTPGHIVFYSQTAHLLIAGDVLFYHSVGRSDLLLGNEQDLLHAIKTKLLCLPENTIVLPGHGQNTTIAEEKQHNPFLQ